MCYYTFRGKITLFIHDLSYLYNLNCILKFAWIYQKKLNDVSWKIKKRRDYSLLVGVDGFEPPTLCL